MSVSNLGDFITSLDTDKKSLLLLLKNTIAESIVQFKSNYVGLFEKVDFDRTIQFLISDGYTLYFKTHSLISILMIKDTSQTNKYKYEECIGYMVSASSFLNMIFDLKNPEFETNNEEYVNLLKACPDKFDMECDYRNFIQDRKKMLFNESVNILNNNLNHIILTYTKINLIIKNIDALLMTNDYF